jgi:hypothetical protein
MPKADAQTVTKLLREYAQCTALRGYRPTTGGRAAQSVPLPCRVGQCVLRWAFQLSVLYLIAAHTIS